MSSGMLGEKGVSTVQNKGQFTTERGGTTRRYSDMTHGHQCGIESLELYLSNGQLMVAQGRCEVGAGFCRKEAAVVDKLKQTKQEEHIVFF